jgi:hypothetical protein
MAERIRTTISLTPEALEIFKRMADAGNMSVSRCMGDWLSDTADAAEMITLKMEEARKAPMRVMNEMRALVAGLADSVDETSDQVRERLRAGRAGGAAAPPSGPPDASSDAEPPSSNTGVLVPPSPSKPKRMKAPAKNWKVI